MYMLWIPNLDVRWNIRQSLLRMYMRVFFTKPFTMFYGETLHYYFSEECNGQTKRTPERVLGMSKVEGTPFSKYQMINQILSARKLDKHHEVKQGLKQYFRQEQYVKEMFVITEED